MTLVIAVWVALKHFVLHFEGPPSQFADVAIFNLTAIVALMMGIKELAVSSGSACTSASLEPSYVLRALVVEEELAHTSLRLGLGRFSTEQEVDYVVAKAMEWDKGQG